VGLESDKLALWAMINLPPGYLLRDKLSESELKDMRELMVIEKYIFSSVQTSVSSVTRN